MITGWLAVLLLVPSAAWAGSRDYDSNHYGSRSGHANQNYGHSKHKHHGKRRGHEKHRVGYYCRPCNHYFSARNALYDHVAYRHRGPSQRLQVSVSFGEFGWIFFGS
jgi:hypothetical protein